MPDHKEAAHGVSDRSQQHRPPNVSGHASQPSARSAQNVSTSVLDKAATDYRVDCRLGLQYFEHVRQQLLIVLQVGVDHCYVRCRASQDSFNASGSKATTVNSLDA